MPDDKPPQGNDGRVADSGNTPPPAPSNDPPAPAGPSAEDKAALAAAEKMVADAEAAKEADKAAAEAAAKDLDKKDKTPDPDPDPDPDKDKKDSPLDVEKWGSTGHEGGDAVLGLMQNAGLEPEQAKALLFDAVMEGDLSKVDRAKLVEAIGEDKAKLVMIGADNFIKDKATKNVAIVKDIQEVAGGEENWAKVAAWAKDDPSLTDDTLSEYIEMIDNGGAQARFAATELVTLYNKSDKNTTLDAPGIPAPVDGDNANTPGGRSLSRNDYAAEVAKLHQHGRVPLQSELDELSAARRRGRG